MKWTLLKVESKVTKQIDGFRGEWYTTQSNTQTLPASVRSVVSGQLEIVGSNLKKFPWLIFPPTSIGPPNMAKSIATYTPNCYLNSKACKIETHCVKIDFECNTCFRYSMK